MLKQIQIKSYIGVNISTLNQPILFCSLSTNLKYKYEPYTNTNVNVNTNTIKIMSWFKHQYSHPTYHFFASYQPT